MGQASLPFPELQRALAAFQHNLAPLPAGYHRAGSMGMMGAPGTPPRPALRNLVVHVRKLSLPHAGAALGGTACPSRRPQHRPPRTTPRRSAVRPGSCCTAWPTTGQGILSLPMSGHLYFCVEPSSDPSQCAERLPSAQSWRGPAPVAGGPSPPGGMPCRHPDYPSPQHQQAALQLIQGMALLYPWAGGAPPLHWFPCHSGCQAAMPIPFCI